MSSCFTFTQFTNSRTKNSNFTFTQVPYQVPGFTHSRVKKSISRFQERKKGCSRVHANHWGDQTQPDEVKNIIRSFDTGKATGPYRILLDLTSTP